MNKENDTPYQKHKHAFSMKTYDSHKEGRIHRNVEQKAQNYIN